MLCSNGIYLDGYNTLTGCRSKRTLILQSYWFSVCQQEGTTCCCFLLVLPLKLFARKLNFGQIKVSLLQRLRQT